MKKYRAKQIAFESPRLWILQKRFLGFFWKNIDGEQLRHNEAIVKLINIHCGKTLDL